MANILRFDPWRHLVNPGLLPTACHWVLAILLMGYCLPALSLDKQGNLVSQPTSNESDPASMGASDQQKETATQAQDKKISSMEERINSLETEVRGNTASIKEIKVQMEETAIQIYEARSKIFAYFDKLEQSITRLNELTQPLEAAKASEESNEDDAKKAGEARLYPGIESNRRGEPLDIFIAAALVLLIPLGWVLIEASRLETASIPQAGMRNLLLISVLLLGYSAIGSFLMYGESILGGMDGQTAHGSALASFWFYQLALVIAAGMVVSTVLSDRISLPAYGIVALILGTVVYPIFGRWVWHGLWPGNKPGWLERLGFEDFAGAAVIYSCAAWFALAWIFVFKPAPADDSPTDMPEEGIITPAYFGLGIFVLWVGWFGLAGGRLDVNEYSSAWLGINTLLAGPAAVLVSFAALMIGRKYQDIHFAYLQLGAGFLAGIVAVSAGLDKFTPLETVAVGAVAGILQTVASGILAKTIFRQDHFRAQMMAVFAICGAWGTIAAGLFGSSGVFGVPDAQQLGIQALGVAVILGFGLLTGLICALGYQGILKACGLGRRLTDSRPSNG